MLLGQGLCSFLSTCIDGARNAAVLGFSLCQNIIRINKLEEQETDFKNAREGFGRAELGRGKQCPN